MKRYLYLLALTCIYLSGCDKETPLSNKVKIEWEYPYYVSKESFDEMDVDKVELFSDNMFLINSVDQLDENPVLVYFSPDVQDQIKSCDFEQYSLIMCSSFFLNEISKFDHTLYKTDSDYVYYQTISTNVQIEEPINSFVFLAVAFCVKKIKGDSKFRYSANVVSLQ